MSDQQKQFLALYRACRHKNQSGFYRARSEEFEKARNQAIYVAAVLMTLTAITSLAADLVGPKWAALLGVFLPALSAALTAYSSLYSFESQSKLYQDALNALGGAEEIGYDAEQANGAEAEVKIAAYVNQVEDVLRKEQGQWGQLISEIKLKVDERS
jgi:ABC-type multidrug transport system fused ATPase/permease subunit